MTWVLVSLALGLIGGTWRVATKMRGDWRKHLDDDDSVR